jgi:hypothetical protein
MLFVSYSRLRPFFMLILSLTALTSPGSSVQRSTVQSSPPSRSDVPVYLPPGEFGAGLMPIILYSMGEPSLLEAAKDVNVRCFRVSYISFSSTTQVAVRLVINVNGSGQVVSTVKSAEGKEVERMKGNVSAADIKSFLQLVEKSGFWSMSSIEQKPDEAGRRTYTMDGMIWMLEGVDNGSFHYVYRPNPSSGPFKEVARYLADSLPKLATP